MAKSKSKVDVTIVISMIRRNNKNYNNINNDTNDETNHGDMDNTTYSLGTSSCKLVFMAPLEENGRAGVLGTGLSLWLYFVASSAFTAVQRWFKPDANISLRDA